MKLKKNDTIIVNGSQKKRWAVYKRFQIRPANTKNELRRINKGKQNVEKRKFPPLEIKHINSSSKRRMQPKIFFFTEKFLAQNLGNVHLFLFKKKTMQNIPNRGYLNA